MLSKTFKVKAAGPQNLGQPAYSRELERNSKHLTTYFRVMTKHPPANATSKAQAIFAETDLVIRGIHSNAECLLKN